MSETQSPEIRIPRFDQTIRESVAEEEHAFGQFERVLDRWLARFKKARAAARYEQDRFLETGVITARRQGAHVLASTSVRLLDLGAGLILLVNARRAHPAYTTSRALVETSASLSYLDQEVLPRLKKGRKDSVDETLRRMHLGLDPGMGFDAKEFPLRPIPVSSMIKAMSRQVDLSLGGDDAETAGTTMSRLYSMLSDHAHPNHSAQHLSASIDDAWMMDWAFDHEWTKESVHDVLGPTYLALHFASEAFDRFLTALTKHPMMLADKRKDRASDGRET